MTRVRRRGSGRPSMELIADTGALYALFDADDGYHEAVRSVLDAETKPAIVPLAILAELDYLIREHLGVDAELALLDNLRSGALRLDLPPYDDLERVRTLVAQYRDLDIGYADASLIATAERFATQRLLTVDERDFRAVTPASGEAFVLLPADA